MLFRLAFPSDIERLTLNILIEDTVIRTQSQEALRSGSELVNAAIAISICRLEEQHILS